MPGTVKLKPGLLETPFLYEDGFRKGNLDKPFVPEEYYGESEKLFNELLVRQDLMDLINAPFK